MPRPPRLTVSFLQLFLFLCFPIPRSRLPSPTSYNIFSDFFPRLFSFLAFFSVFFTVSLSWLFFSSYFTFTFFLSFPLSCLPHITFYLSLPFLLFFCFSPFSIIIFSSYIISYSPFHSFLASYSFPDSFSRMSFTFYNFSILFPTIFSSLFPLISVLLCHFPAYLHFLTFIIFHSFVCILLSFLLPSVRLVSLTLALPPSFPSLLSPLRTCPLFSPLSFLPGKGHALSSLDPFLQCIDNPLAVALAEGRNTHVGKGSKENTD